MRTGILPKENYFNPGRESDSLVRSLRNEPELWDMFTRKEEYNPTNLDKHQRFDYSFSKNKEIMNPRVSGFLIENGLKIQYPENKPFALCLTHDIDAVNYKLLRVVKILKNGKYTTKQAMKMAFNKLSKRCNLLWNFRDIMDIEEKYGGKSTFFFMALAKGDKDHTYDIDRLRDEIKTITQRGWEVGLHGGHDAYCDINKLKAEKARLELVLGRPVIGYRNHYLKFKVPDTWNILSQAGIGYDSSLGYPSHVGFRNGMCHPFKPYDLNANGAVDLIEIPLNIMDGSFDEYMKTDMNESWRISKGLIDTVHKHRGVLTVVWHNSFMVNDWLKLYEKILKYGKEKGAWMASGEEIYKNAVGDG